ncbi:hypothetical protein K523DRAFT_319226 [Schizophyllum commune Tattone D]|nr:hypothetical protein K523DRAFT_319226 [Schizophyllum commune Tattone D]
MSPTFTALALISRALLLHVRSDLCICHPLLLIVSDIPSVSAHMMTSFFDHVRHLS